MSPSANRQQTVLTIDDNPQFLSTVDVLLTGDGYRVLSALSGQDGLWRARTERPDLILLDYSMPITDGLALLFELKAGSATRRIPILALMSGMAAGANRLSLAGSIGFIPKPFEPREFLRLIAGILKATIGRSRQPYDP